MILNFSNGEFDAQVGDVFYCTGDVIVGCSSEVSDRTGVPWEIVKLGVDGWEIAARPLCKDDILADYLHDVTGFLDPHYYLFSAYGLRYEGRESSSVLCYYCGQVREDTQIIDGRRICPDCFAEHTFTCIECGRIHDTRRRMKGLDLCRPCFDRQPEKYRRAVDDGKVYLVTDLIETADGKFYTPAYAESNLDKCCECGRYISPDNTLAYEGNTYCRRHLPYSATKCYYCETYHPMSEMTVINEVHVCKRCLEQNYFKCANCGEYFSVWTGTTFRDTNERICDECYKEFKCDICGYAYRDHEKWSHNVTVWKNVSRNHVIKAENVCHSCMSFTLHKCADCDDYIYPVHNFAMPDKNYYCGNHVHNHFVKCNECGRWKSRSERFMGLPDDCMCIDCFEDANHGTSSGYSGAEEDFIAESGIMDYSNKPDPIFYPDTNIIEVTDALYMGVELEVDDGYDEDIVVDHANEIFKITYGKHDGSLGRHGIEFVSHPATIKYFMDHKDDWKAGMSYLQGEGYTSHDAGTCGLHVHVSSFPLLYETDNGIEKLLWFQDKYWDQLLNFSRRNASQVNEWARRIPAAPSARITDKSEIIASLRNAKKDAKNKGRYQAINLQNKNTVEFRIFRGTLNIDTFIATLQLVSNLCELACLESFDEFKELSWEDVVNYHEYAELKEYWESRHLGILSKDMYDRDDGSVLEAAA